MRIEKYISDLLFGHNCVVIPEFGGFLANTRHVKLDTDSNTLVPPSKVISFNTHLTNNDGLLVSHIAKIKNLDYQVVLDKVLLISKEWKQKLEQGDKLTLENLGALELSSEGKIQFLPENQINYFKNSFGMTTISAIPIKRESLKVQIDTLEEKVPLKITPERRKESALRPWLKYAAVFMLLVSVGATSYLGYKNFNQSELFVEEQAEKEVSKKLQRATFFDTQPIELPALELKVEKVADGPRHHIIAGAFRLKENADRKVQQLKTAGFNAAYIGTNSFGLHQVTFASYSDRNEALVQLRQIRENSSPDAWILTKK